MNWIARLKKAEEKQQNAIEVLEREYHDTLARYRSPESENLPQKEFDRMLTRLDELYRELTSRGIDLPVNTPEGKAYIKEAAMEELASEEAA